MGVGCSRLNEPVAIAPQQNVKETWNTHQADGFQISLPASWHADTQDPQHFTSSLNEKYYLIYRVVDLKAESNASLDNTVLSLYKNGKLLDAERAGIEGRCKETDACGQIKESTNLSIKDGQGIEFIIQYKGLGFDDPDKGFLNEIHRTIRKGDELYMFWTSEQVAPAELLNKYPKLDPSPFDIFRKIMDTFQTI